ncbi:MAG TPA: methyltransferase domain-containing protein [Candidatus Binataceae bacterium]|nr:methyltransferase domain-containing protein [Candidatus Binataceae bacterium]
MSENLRASWEVRHRVQRMGAPEPFVAEMLPLLPRGVALDIAAGTGRHSLLLARSGFHVHAIDFSMPAMFNLGAAAAAENLPVYPLVADLETYPLPSQRYDAILNTTYLDRELIPALKDALKIGGAFLFDTFLIDQAETGHPRNPAFMLNHYELRSLLSGLEISRYREGITVYPSGNNAWRAGAVAFRRS